MKIAAGLPEPCGTQFSLKKEWFLKKVKLWDSIGFRLNSLSKSLKDPSVGS